MYKRIGLYTGSFDPITNGHLDIIKRASKIFDKLYIGLFKNNDKQTLLSLVERKQILDQLLTDLDNIEIIVHESELTVSVAENLGVTALVRSIRNSQDLVYESEMFFFNRELTGIETIYLLANPKLQYISSSRIKELASFGADISNWVPCLVRDILEKKIEKN